VTGAEQEGEERGELSEMGIGESEEKEVK